MSLSDQYLVKLGEQISRLKQSKSVEGQPRIGFQRAIISGIEGNGTLQCGIIGADGSTVETIPACLPWGAGARASSVGDLVLLFYDPAFPVPFVFNGSAAVDPDALDFGVAGSIKFFTQ